MKTSFGKTIISKSAACIAAAALAASMTPAVAFADDAANDQDSTVTIENQEPGENDGEANEENADAAQEGATASSASDQGSAEQEVTRTEVSTADQLNEAIAAGGAILLKSDIDIDKAITVASDVQLDLGGHTLTAQGTMAFDVYGTLAISNGTLKSANTSNTAVVWVNQTAKVDVASDAVIEAAQDCFCIAYWSDCTSASVTVAGALTGANGVTVNGLIKDTTTDNSLVVTGKIEVQGHGIYQAGFSNVSVEEGSVINAGATGIETRAGNLTVKGGTITGGSRETTCTANGNGTTIDNAGIAIAQHTTKLPISVRIENGNISGTSAVYEANPQQNDQASLDQISLAINGGSFKGNIYAADISGFVYGGTFASDPSAYLAEGYSASIADDGSYSVGKTEASETPGTDPSEPDAPVESETPANITIIDDNPAKVNGIAFDGCVSYSAAEDAAGIVEIPPAIKIGEKTYAVTAIADNAFVGNTAIEEVVIPDTVSSIGYAAFKKCASLKSVSIPESVTYIDERAFSRCSALTDIELPSSIAAIGQYAFYSDSSLARIEIPSNVASIGKSAFKNCTSLTQIAIPSAVKTVSKRAFQGCTALESVTVPKTVETLGYKAFAGCKNIASATVKARDIGERAFQNNTALKTVVIGDKVTSIGQAAFKNDVKLASVTIGSKVSSIAKYAFNGTEKLSKITLTGNKLTKAGTKNCLKGSSIAKVVVDYSTASKNQKLADTYAAYFSKSNCGKKVTVTAAK